jgi:ribonuclease T2
MRLVPWAVLLALAWSGEATAQAFQCRLPERLEPFRQPQQEGPTRRLPVSGYTLAVSWSPEYCRGDRQSMQCSGRNGRFGFVLHGLWPESRSGPPPQWCNPTLRPYPELIRRNLCMTPVPWMLAHEWAKHGSCIVATPEAYFRISSILWRSLRWPDADRLSRQPGLTAGDLRRAFAEANPDWRGKRVGLLVSRTGWLRELRLCYGRDFMPADCPRRSFGPPDAAPLKIWRGL